MQPVNRLDKILWGGQKCHFRNQNPKIKSGNEANKSYLFGCLHYTDYVLLWSLRVHGKRKRWLIFRGKFYIVHDAASAVFVSVKVI